jgi:phage terminase large subunit-like protein
VARDEERGAMRWEPSLRRLTFASGAQAFVYSGASGESLRGPEHHFAWCDELAKWRRPQESWDNLMLGLRAGERPQAVVTTTPRAVPALRRILELGGVVRTGGRSRDNPHVAALSVEASERAYGGTRFGRQELDGELIEELEGALWTRETIERVRRPAAPPREALKRVAIGVDPPATAWGDECGIVACAVDRDGLYWVLADHSGGGLSPEGWARKVAQAAEHLRADLIVAEGNNGGEMVEAVLRGAGVRLPVKRVHARLGKARRAEPVALRFESGEARIAGAWPKLEDQMAALVTGGDWQGGNGQGGGGQGGSGSPDRADAMVWAMTELMLKPDPAVPRIRTL